MGTEQKHALSRRDFVKWSAAAAGMGAAAGLIGCQNDAGDGSSVGNIEIPAMNGEWKNAICWFGCGGNCVNQCYVEDGVVLYQRTDTIGEDSNDGRQQRGCFRGRSLRHMVFGDDRIKFPVRRKNWEPGGGDRSLRGCDEWVRLSWDEALDLAAAELKRIIETYGNKGILTSETVGPGRFFNSIGGTTTFWSCWSSGGIYHTSQMMVGGGWPRHALTLSDRYEYLSSKLIILWGHNPVWSSQGNPILNFLEAKKRGAKIIVIDPIYHDSAKVLADQFIGVRPCTDAAMLLGVAHEMIINNLHNQEFLDKYCVGFDAEHMPAGANPQDNFKDYVLGTYDGTPKTAEWASEICGAPADVIKELAREMATTKPLALTCSRAPARTSRGDQFAQVFLTVGWMTGEVGKFGSMAGHIVTSNVGSGTGGPWLINAGASGVKAIPNPVSPYNYYTIDPTDTSEWYTINHSEIWDAVIDGKWHAGVKGIQDINIQCINHMGRGDTLNQSPATKRGIEAHRKVEFVIASGYYMNPNAAYADIVFPACTKWEEAGDTLSSKTNRETILSAEQITEPLFEAMPDGWIEAQMAERMGADPNEVTPLSTEQMGFNAIMGATTTLEDGKTTAPLFTIEDDDIPEGVEGAAQQGEVSYKQFKQDGYTRVTRKEGDNYGYTALKDYIDDPVANPRDTQSGKLEIHCQAISDFCAAVGYTDKPPIGVYQVPEEGYEATFSDWANKVKGEYPFQLVTLHCLRTAHSSFDNVPYCREAAPNDLQINSRDASELGIEKGDTVLIKSKWGQSLRIADVTERIMPGVIKLDQATWVDVNEDDGIDQAGSANYLVGPLKTGSGIQAWNSCICSVEKWTGEALMPDCEWPQRVVEG